MTLLTDYLRRYTDLPALIHLLKTKTITFLDPVTWDDQNDAYFMSLYKQKNRLKTLLAICLSQESETYHHWRVFSHGSSGVCISFNRQLLIHSLEFHSSVRFGPVTYLKVTELGKRKNTVKELPFLKRAPFEPEQEFRFIYESSLRTHRTKSYPIPMSAIDKIYLSPWMPKSVSESVKACLRSIPGADKIDIRRSTLIQNDTWQSFGDRVVAP